MIGPFENRMLSCRKIFVGYAIERTQVQKALGFLASSALCMLMNKQKDNGYTYLKNCNNCRTGPVLSRSFANASAGATYF